MHDIKNIKDRYGGDTCLDETRINKYVLRQCSAKERQDIEAHLAICSQCRREVVLLKKIQPDIQDDKKWCQLPQGLYSKAIALVKGMSGSPVTTPNVPVLEICIRFVCEKWEVIRHTGRIMPQPAFAIRGDMPEKGVILSNIVKEFDEFRVEAGVNENAEGTVDLHIRVKRLEDTRLKPQLRFILTDIKRGRILEESIREGEISFEGLEQGLYSIRITQQERPVGEISFCAENPEE